MQFFTRAPAGLAAFLTTFLMFAGFLCDPGRSGPSEDDLAKLEAEIMELIGGADATDASYCQTIAFGSKPCGGPWRYLVYSTQTTDSTLLRSKVERYNRLQAERNRELGLVSDCSLAVRPETGLVEGRCSAVN